MKIVIFDMDNLKNPFWAAGQARATREVGKILAKKHSVVVYCAKYPGYKNYSEDGIRYVHVGINSKYPKINNFAFIFTIPYMVRKIKADVIIENFNAPTSVSFAPLFTKIPVIALPTMFNAEEFSRKYHLPFYLIERYGMKFYKYIMPYSDVDASKALRLNPKITYKVIPQGVSKEYFKINHLKPEYILFLGRFDLAQKGVDLLIKAYSRVANRIKYPLVVAGKGPDEKKIKDLIEKLNLTSKVSIVGPAYGEKKFDLISKAFFVAFPSKHDELSLWMLEAFASGMPIVSFDLPELKWAGEKAMLKAKKFDIDEYAELMMKLVDPKVNQGMRIEARNLAKKYTWEKVANDFETFINYVLSKEKSL